MNWSALPLGLFGLLNIFLAFVAPTQARGTAGASAVFAAAGLLILGGVWRGVPAAVLVGYLLGMLAPVWMGVLMSGNVNPLHIAVRFVIVALLFGLWLHFRP